MSEAVSLDPDHRGRIYVVTEHYRGARLDRFLQAMIPRLSRERIQRAIATRVETSWHPAPRPALRAVPGGEVLVRFIDVVESEPTATPSVVYEDETLLVVDKPAGLLVHPTHTCRRNNLFHILSSQRPGERIALAHRLDRETSGLLVIARTVIASRHLGAQFARGRVQKTYTALVHGVVEADHGVLDRPLGVSRRLDVLFRRSADGDRAQAARTDFRVARRFARYTLLSVFPRTGRRHQIRAHLAEAGHPIVGDKLYATDDRFYLKLVRSGLDDSMRDRLLADRQLLHASEIAFAHPTDRRTMTFRSELTEDFRRFLWRLEPEQGLYSDAGEGARTITDWPSRRER